MPLFDSFVQLECIKARLLTKLEKHNLVSKTTCLNGTSFLQYHCNATSSEFSISARISTIYFEWKMQLREEGRLSKAKN